ncbi:PadR family transcriptional regulator [Deinococcus maricopensis]|uniref:Transcriptional regulator, PadR-like family n=1 Tax=Deinococcus maricopensis (strain DSM 21211 / LMG 22137 / NRRL B-23946 / LB-34) TaxID=709986 RepID=E8UB18_DEIML|nr:PadR family transcriptional regulator [Deinococcus maricopensis]ADV68257.1 transcriptional regulator, PadR-like family [Deinococcus maricopensis DSM 21211]
MDPTLVRGNLDLVLLSILEGGERYGLDISKEANTRTDGYFQLNAGSLYPALHRLEKHGWIQSQERQPPRGGPSVRYYTLTDAGRAELHRKRSAYDTFHAALRALWS